MAQWIFDGVAPRIRSDPSKNYTGIIGNELWLVRRELDGDISMYVRNLDMKQWIECKFVSNPLVVRCLDVFDEGFGQNEIDTTDGLTFEDMQFVVNQQEQEQIQNELEEDVDDEDREENDFEDPVSNSVYISITNGTIYMFQTLHTGIGRLLEFDREILEWKVLKRFRNLANIREMKVFNDKMYILSGIPRHKNVQLKVVDMKTFNIIPEAAYLWEFVGLIHLELVEVNGVMYAIFANRTGKRAVYSIDHKSYKCEKIYEKEDEIPYDYCRTSLFYFSSNNCLYQLFFYEETITFERFNFDKKEWVYQSKQKLETDMCIFNASEKNGRIYVIYIKRGTICSFVMRVLDLEPKLSAICSLAIARDGSKKEFKRLKLDVPMEIRHQLDDALTVRKAQKAKRPFEKEDDSDSEDEILPKRSRIEEEDEAVPESVQVSEPTESTSIFTRFKQYVYSWF